MSAYAHEFRNESANWFAIFINGKYWKSFPPRAGKSEAGSLYYYQVWCAEKSAETGKEWKAITVARGN